MTPPNKWQLKAMVTGKKLTTSSDWDGKSLGEIYLTLRGMGATNRGALEVVAAIKDNRFWAMTGSQVPHVSKDQAFAWLVENGVEAGEASCRVWGEETEEVASAIQTAKSLHWSWLNQQHRQALEDARMAS